MIRILRFIFTGSWHEHKWIELHRGRLVDSDNVTVGHYYECKCEHCGKIKAFKV